MPNNIKAMRDALEMIESLYKDGLICTTSEMSCAEHDRIDDGYHAVKNALSAPARNCDIGTRMQMLRRYVFSREKFAFTPDDWRGYADWLLDKAEDGGKSQDVNPVREMRNIDVGTPEEQGTRFLEWLDKGSISGKRPIDAIFEWAQIPYKGDGGANE